MKIAVLKETAAGETRCAAIPETVKKLAGLGAEVAVESGAGEGAAVSDADFEAAGAKTGSRADVLKGAGIILVVTGPDPKSLMGAEKGAILIGTLDPARRRADIEAYAAAGFEALAMEWLPQITRAQSMDILSSQSNLAGYKAVVEAADAYGRAFPMMMTAAGTVSPAKVFVMGVGVAGLQAIATAKRLGAQVSATDVRSATREQILSLGAKPIFVENVAGIEGEGAGGYATEMSDEYKAAQAELVSSHLAKQDIVITTALIPGTAGAAPDHRCPGRFDASRRRDRRYGRGCRRKCRGHGAGRAGREAWCDDHWSDQPRAQPRRRRVGPVRTQSVQFPQCLLGSGARQAGASRR